MGTCPPLADSLRHPCRRSAPGPRTRWAPDRRGRPVARSRASPSPSPPRWWTSPTGRAG